MDTIIEALLEAHNNAQRAAREALCALSYAEQAVTKARDAAGEAEDAANKIAAALHKLSLQVVK